MAQMVKGTLFEMFTKIVNIIQDKVSNISFYHPRDPSNEEVNIIQDEYEIRPYVIHGTLKMRKCSSCHMCIR